MRRSRVFLWCALLGLLAVLVIVQWQRTAAPVRQQAGEAGPQIRAAGTGPRTELVAGAPVGRADDDAGQACVRILDDAAKFALVEGVDASPDAAGDWGKRSLLAELLHIEFPGLDQPGDEAERLFTEIASLQQRLAGSGNPEHYLTMVLLDPVDARVAGDRSVHTNLAELGARAAAAGSPLLAWHALRICVEAKDQCPFIDLEQRLLGVDRQNAEAWALVAVLRHQRGDTLGALAAMQGAAKASTSTSYWTRTVEVVDRTMAGHSEIPYPLRIATAFGSAATAGSVSPLAMCRAESASRAWAEACLAFGNLKALRDESMLGRSISFSLREQALTALDRTEAAAEVAVERALYDAERYGEAASEVNRARHAVQSALLNASPARFDAYLAALREHGESAGAREFLRQQLPALLERAGLLGRDGARECAAQFIGAPEAAAGSRAATAGHRLQIADRLLVSVRGRRNVSVTVQVSADGSIVIPRLAPLPASGRTIGDLERDIVAAFSTPGRPAQAQVILLAPRTQEHRLLEFDEALQSSRGDAGSVGA